MQNIIRRKILIFLIGSSISFAQIEFDVSWTPYVTYYLSMVDINTGESNMPIFMAELKKEVEGSDSVPVNIEFEIIIDSDALSVKNQTLVKVETKEPLNLIAPIHLSNMDLNLSTGSLFDINGNAVDLELDILDEDFDDLDNEDQPEEDRFMLTINQRENLRDSIVTMKKFQTLFKIETIR